MLVLVLASLASPLRRLLGDCWAALQPNAVVAPYACVMVHRPLVHWCLVTALVYFFTGPMAVGHVFNDTFAVLCYWGIIVPRYTVHSDVRGTVESPLE